MSKKRVIVKTPKGDFEVDKYIKMIQKEEKELEEQPENAEEVI